MPICTEVVPPEISFDDGVRVACHLFTTASEGATGSQTTTLEPTAAPAST
jgi:hypothetical protein